MRGLSLIYHGFSFLLLFLCFLDTLTVIVIDDQIANSISGSGQSAFSFRRTAQHLDGCDLSTRHWRWSACCVGARGLVGKRRGFRRRVEIEYHAHFIRAIFAVFITVIRLCFRCVHSVVLYMFRCVRLKILAVGADIDVDVDVHVVHEELFLAL